MNLSYKPFFNSLCEIFVALKIQIIFLLGYCVYAHPLLFIHLVSLTSWGGCQSF